MVELADVKPMLLDERPVNYETPGCFFEIKYDGYRLLAEFGDGACKLKSRNGADATKWFPELQDALSKVPGGPYIVDGEVCVLGGMGRSDFIRLQGRARKKRWYEGADPVTYCVFDLLAERGLSLMAKPLHWRKKRLGEILTPAPHSVLYVHHLEDRGRELFEQAAHQLKLEGIVAKRADSLYEPGKRSRDWVKIKRKGAVPPERFKRS